MSRFLVAALVSGSGASISAQDAKSLPAASLRAPAELDLGKFPYGPQIVKGSFLLTNAGTKPIELRRIRSSCLCMVLDPVEARLAPGATLTVNLTLDLGYREGPFVHPVMVYSDDPGHPITRIDVKVDVPMAVGFTPKANLFGLIPRGAPLGDRRFDLAIFAKDRRALPPPKVTSTSPYLKVSEVTAEKAPEGTPYHRVRLAVDPAIPFGNYNESLIVETMHPDQPLLTLAARWRVAPDLVGPDPVDPGVMEEGRPTTGTFVVRNLGVQPVSVLRAEPKLGVPADVTVTPKDKDLEVNLSLPGGPAPWALRGTIDLHTNHPEQPVVTVRLDGKVWARDPFARVAADPHQEAELLEVLEEALLEEESLPMARVMSGVLGGVTDDRAVDLLLRALKDGRYFPTRARAAVALGLIKNPRSVPALKWSATFDADDDVRRQSTGALCSILGKEALPVVELLLQDEEEVSRMHAADLLGDIDDSRSVALLRRALTDVEDVVVQSARASLKKLGVPEITLP